MRTPALVLVGGLAALALVAASAAPAAAADFYVDPVNGSPTGTGSAADPWRTLEEVVAANLIETRHWASLPYQPGATLVVVNPGAPVTAGDTLWLRSGYHGELFLRGAYNAAPITVAAAPGEVPRLRRVWLSAAQNWIVRGLVDQPVACPGTAHPGHPGLRRESRLARPVVGHRDRRLRRSSPSPTPPRGRRASG